MLRNTDIICLREAHIVNIKHHWWWKLNFVSQFFSFDHLVLLEEDHALTSDALHVMELMESLPNQADLMTLGHYKSNLKLGTQVSCNSRIISALSEKNPMIGIFCEMKLSGHVENILFIFT